MPPASSALSSQKPSGTPSLPFSSFLFLLPSSLFQPFHLLRHVRGFGPARRTPNGLGFIVGGSSDSLQGPLVGRREDLSPEERLSSGPFSVDAMEASNQRTPRSPKMGNPQTGSLRGTRKSASRSNKTSLKTKGRVSNVAGTETDTGIPRRADNER